MTEADYRCPDCGRETCTGEDCYWPDEAGIPRPETETPAKCICGQPATVTVTRRCGPCRYETAEDCCARHAGSPVYCSRCYRSGFDVLLEITAVTNAGNSGEPEASPAPAGERE